jgi:DNA-binding NtrC family response regulator/predicted hydrocarbon binding protein
MKLPFFYKLGRNIVRACDLERLELLGIDRSRGLPLFGDYRMVMFGMPSLARLQKDLIQSLGMEKASVILARFGYDSGLGIATAISELYDFDSPEEWLKSGAVLRTMAGLAKEEIQEVKIDTERKTFHMTGRWMDSFESVNWLTQFKPYEAPVCVTLAALSSGFASAVLGSEVLVKETCCRAQGHEYCQFEGRPIAEWGITPDDLYQKFELQSLEAELSKLKTALSQAREDLRQQHVEISQLRILAHQSENDGDIVFRSPSMAKVLTLARKVAPTKSSVLIYGESGVGKEVLARFIHQHSTHADMPFMAINCAALPPNLLESELFGHVKGAFTGADSNKKGLFVEAGEGTLFLDEVGEISPELQAKLLRVLQEKEVRPVGGVEVIKIRARVVSATNQDLKTLILLNRFREDLYYRLSVFPLYINPLRERREDILILARYFLTKLNIGSKGFSPSAIRIMQSYQWPGNVRELSNWIEYGVILAGDEQIQPEHLPAVSSDNSEDILPTLMESALPSLEELEKRYIHLILQKTGNRRGDAAKKLGISTATLWRKLNLHQESKNSSLRD